MTAAAAVGIAVRAIQRTIGIRGRVHREQRSHYEGRTGLVTRHWETPHPVKTPSLYQCGAYRFVTCKEISFHDVELYNPANTTHSNRLPPILVYTRACRRRRFRIDTEVRCVEAHPPFLAL